MVTLREKIAVICADDTDDSWMRWLPCADRILAIPEIAEALRKPWDTTGVINIPVR